MNSPMLLIKKRKISLVSFKLLWKLYPNSLTWPGTRKVISAVCLGSAACSVFVNGLTESSAELHNYFKGSGYIDVCSHVWVEFASLCRVEVSVTWRQSSALAELQFIHCNTAEMQSDSAWSESLDFGKDFFCWVAALWVQRAYPLKVQYLCPVQGNVSWRATDSSF